MLLLVRNGRAEDVTSGQSWPYPRSFLHGCKVLKVCAFGSQPYFLRQQLLLQGHLAPRRARLLLLAVVGADARKF